MSAVVARCCGCSMCMGHTWGGTVGGLDGLVTIPFWGLSRRDHCEGLEGFSGVYVCAAACGAVCVFVISDVSVSRGAGPDFVEYVCVKHGSQGMWSKQA